MNITEEPHLFPPTPRRHTQIQYLALERELAKVLGWTQLQTGGINGMLRIPKNWLIGYSPADDAKLIKERVPNWTRNLGEAAKLAVDNGISFFVKEDEAYSMLDIDPDHTWTKIEKVSHHGDKYIACATAIVTMLIDKFEREEEQKATY